MMDWKNFKVEFVVREKFLGLHLLQRIENIWFKRKYLEIRDDGDVRIYNVEQLKTNKPFDINSIEGDKNTDDEKIL